MINMNHLLYLLLFCLSTPFLQATRDMAKTSRKACVICHRTARGGQRGRPQLRPYGLRYLTKLIKKDGYIPTNVYRKLGNLSAQISENRRKLVEAEEAKKAKEKQVKKAAEEVVKNAPTEVGKGEGKALKTKKVAEKKLGPKSGKPKPKQTISKRAEAVKKKTPVAPPSFSRSVKRIKKVTEVASTPVVKAPPKTEKPKEGVYRFKGGKTFILKRKPKVVDVDYDWEDDWEFDDYY
jgi:hypothetical protein